MTTDELSALSREELLEALARARSGEGESARALHDLRVHQIELEMQNRELRATHEALEASRNRYAELYDFAPVAYATLNETGTVLDINFTGATMIGIDRAHIVGRPLNALVRIDGPAAFWNHLRECRQTRRPAFADFRFQNKHGAVFDVRASTSPAFDNAGGVTLRTAFIDVTEKKRIEDDQRLLAELGEVVAPTLDHESTPASIARFAVARLADLCIVETIDDDNRAMQREIAHRDPAMAGVVELLRQRVLDASRPHLGSFALGSAVPSLVTDLSHTYLKSIAQDRAQEQALVDLAPRSMIVVPLWARGRQVGFVVLLRTQASATQYAARDLPVATEIGRRAALALDNARLYRAAQDAVRAREDVLAVVAHDLRTPLTVILVEASRMQGVREGEVIEAAARRMRTIVDDLLDIARIDGGGALLRREPVAVRPLLESVVAGHVSLARQLKIELVLQLADTGSSADGELTNAYVHIDHDRMLRVFENLIGNALKFTPPEGRVVVAARRRGDRIVFSVSDTGPGIPPDDVPHLFDRFWQGKRARGGSGVGLAIVKGIIGAHGGTISVTSGAEQNVGATFSFVLPLASPPQAL